MAVLLVLLLISASAARIKKLYFIQMEKDAFQNVVKGSIKTLMKRSARHARPPSAQNALLRILVMNARRAITKRLNPSVRSVLKDVASALHLPAATLV